MLAALERLEKERERERSALIRVAREASLASEWIHDIPAAGRGESGASLLKELDDALSKLVEVIT